MSTSLSRRSRGTSTKSNIPDLSTDVSSPEENFHSFSKLFLKNKSSLVQRRLALQRQRATLRDPVRHFGPVQLECFQMELGNPQDCLLHMNVNDDPDDDNDDDNTTNNRETGIASSMEHDRLQLCSRRTGAPRLNSAHTAPTDISLLYKHKSPTMHPVTGENLEDYLEDDGTPSPCSYVLPRKSCREKNAPAFSFGSRCLVEKNGGSRTAWNKQWFANTDPFTLKVDFKHDSVWPSPGDHEVPTTLGAQTTKVSFPMWSIGTRLHNHPKQVQENFPSPNTYETLAAFQKLTAKNTQITLKSRPGGTQLSTKSSKSIVPGPGAHDQTKFLLNKYSSPKYSFGRRLPTALGQDPYVNTLPQIFT